MIIKDNMANMCAKVTSTYMEFTLAFGPKLEFSFSFKLLEAVNVMLGAYLAAYKTYVPSRFVYNIKSTDARQKAQISEDSTILTTGTISQYPCKISCKAQWDKKNEPIEFQRVILKEDARTKFGGSNPMQPTVIEGEKTCTGIRDAIKAGICSDANKK